MLNSWLVKRTCIFTQYFKNKLYFVHSFSLVSFHFDLYVYLLFHCSPSNKDPQPVAWLFPKRVFAYTSSKGISSYLKVVAAGGYCFSMEKYGAYKPDEETIEAWLDGFEARLLCHDIVSNDRKRHWCQALVGEAGRNILKKLPLRATWAQVKQELIDVLGEANPRDRAFDILVNYRAGDKGLGEIAADIIAKAIKATDDAEM